VALKDKSEEEGDRGRKGLRKGTRCLKEYKTTDCLKKRMMMMAFRMSCQPGGRASRKRKGQEILGNSAGNG